MSKVLDLWHSILGFGVETAANTVVWSYSGFAAGLAAWLIPITQLCNSGEWLVAKIFWFAGTYGPQELSGYFLAASQFMSSGWFTNIVKIASFFASPFVDAKIFYAVLAYILWLNFVCLVIRMIIYVKSHAPAVGGTT